jgi:hypothetical protein
MVSKVKKTRGRRMTRKAVATETVEGLHASFGKLDAYVRTLIAKGCTDSKLSACIRKEWSSLFHSDISTPAIRGMIRHYRSVHKKNRKTRRNQRGGMAPMDWTMSQGTTEQVHGRFPVEIGVSPQAIRALDMGRFFESTGGRTCNSTGGHAAPGQAGGSAAAAAGWGHFPASVPRNPIEAVGSTLQGAPITNPHASPVSPTTNLAVYNPDVYPAKDLMPISTLGPVFTPY